ncbi:MAG: VanZ family protein [Actinomycetota bacterium]|nr:VanZ family protein [Actinomycetota bacterium]
MYLIDGPIPLLVGTPFVVIWCAARLIRGASRSRVALEALFALYVLGLLGVTLFPILLGTPPEDVLGGGIADSVNLVPLRSLAGIIGVGHRQVLRQIGGNIVLFVPLGVMGPLLWPRMRSIGGLLVVGVVASVTVELLQLAQLGAHVAFARSVDIDDVLLNTCGALVGWGLWRVARALTNKGIERTASGRINQ